MLPPKLLFPIQRWKIWTKTLNLNICNWITDFFFLSFYRLQGDVVRLWCCMRAGPNRPLQGRVCLQESGMSFFSGTCLRLGFVYLLQWVWARKSPVQRTATHQSATPGSLLWVPWFILNFYTLNQPLEWLNAFLDCHRNAHSDHSKGPGLWLTM